MSNERKYWLYEVLWIAVVGGAAVVVYPQTLWKGVLLGMAFGATSVIAVRQDRIRL